MMEWIKEHGLVLKVGAHGCETRAARLESLSPNASRSRLEIGTNSESADPAEWGDAVRVWLAEVVFASADFLPGGHGGREVRNPS